MKSTVVRLLGLLVMSSLAILGTRAADNTQSKRPPESNSISEQQMMTDLFDRWERVWHEGQLDLVPSCVGDHYIRHDENGDRTVTRDAYAAEIAKAQHDRPGIRFVVYDHSFNGDRAWFRYATKWTDPKTGEARSRAGIQSYRIEGGKLVETWVSSWPLGSTWTDTPQEHWTSPPAIK